LEELKQAHDFMSKDDRLIIFDPEESRDADNIINKIIYFVKAHNCRVVFLDHISMLAYANEDDNERKFLDKLLADLKNLTVTLDICIHAIIHVNDEGKTRGSRAPGQLCNAMIMLERDKLSADPVVANTTLVVVEDNRMTGESGLACKLFFDRETGRMTELDATFAVEVAGDRSVSFDA
jgi:twinkle protein